MTGLRAITIVGIFTGDAVRQRVHVGFAEDDCSLGAQAGGHGGVFAGGGVAFRVETRTGGGDEPFEVEAIF